MHKTLRFSLLALFAFLTFSAQAQVSAPQVSTLGQSDLIPVVPGGRPSGQQQFISFQNLTNTLPYGLGKQLSAAYQSATAAGNYIDNPPWFACVSGNNANLLLVCSAWQASTAYGQGAVVSNGGHLYVASGAGTSASSGGPTGQTNVAQTDGSVTWYYFGEPRSTANDANASVISTATTTTPFSGAVWWVPSTYPQQYTVYGASFFPVSSFERLYSGNYAAATPRQFGGKVCALVTDTKFAVTTGNNNRFGLTIDGRELSPQQELYSSGGPSGIVLDFSSTSGFKTRNICFYQSIANGALGGIFTTAAGSVTPAPIAPASMAFVYDSYDAGSAAGPWSGYGLLSQQAGERLGLASWSLSQGGTGPQNPGASLYNYQQRIADTTNAGILAGVQMVVTNLSTNDAACTGSVTASCPTGSEATAIQNVLSGIRSVNSTALIVVFGPAPINNGSSYSSYVTEDSTYGPSVTSWSDPAGPGHVCYIPWANSSVFTPVVASYITGVPTGLPSTAQLINTADSTHPYDLGITIIAKWMTTQIATQCYPNLK